MATGTPQVVAVVSGMPSPPAGPGTPGTVPNWPPTPTQVGLGNVTNDAQVKRSEMGSANGVASLDGTGLVPTAQLPLATPSSPGAAPNFPPTLDQIGVDAYCIGVFPAFVANAASIAPGTDKANSYTCESTRTLVAAAALTIATTGLTSRACDVFVLCKALTLGFIMSIVNGGPAAGTIGTFAASLTKPEAMRLWWDGTNFIFNGQDWIAP